MEEFSVEKIIDGHRYLMYYYKESGFRYFYDFEEKSAEQVFQSLLDSKITDKQHIYSTYCLCNTLANKEPDFFEKTYPIFCKLMYEDNGDFITELKEYVKPHPIPSKPIPLCYTYLAKSEHHPYIKIGRTQNLSRREFDLKCADPTIKIFAYSEQNIEKQLYDQFLVFNIDREWFNLSEEQIKLIMSKYNFQECD